VPLPVVYMIDLADGEIARNESRFALDHGDPVSTGRVLIGWATESATFVQIPSIRSSYP
jgi:hypothetical protein